nr:hypothetical protein [Tanacetum cinerariifolium]
MFFPTWLYGIGWDLCKMRDKVLLVKAQRNSKVLNEEELKFFADHGIAEGPVTRSVITHNAAYQVHDLDTYDSDYDEVSTAKAVLLANLSSYGSNVLSKVPHSNNTHNDMLNKSVQEMPYSEQPHLVNYPENEINSDSNIIPYSQYLLETQNAAVQDTNSSAQQDAMILSVFEQLSHQNGDQPLPVIAQVSLAGNAQNAPPTLKDPKFWIAEKKKTRKIDRLERSLLIQGLPNDIYSLIDSNETAKDLWDALERHMRGSEYGGQDMKAAILYEYKTFKATEGEQLLDTYLRDVNDALGYKKKVVVITSDPLALVAEKTKVSKRKEKVVVSSDSEESGAVDFSELKKITALLAKAFNRRKFYSKLKNNNLRTSSTSQSTNKKQEFAKSDE